MIGAISSLPYPGLRSFRREESYLFFGRTRCIDSMVDTLASTRFLAVLGSSGSGKSSLVRTGLLDSLELGLHPSGSRWKIADMHPGDKPIANLAEALLKIGRSRREDYVDIASLEKFLSRGPLSIVEWAADNLDANCNLLLIADQFEEIFRFGDYAEREETEKFIDLLSGSASAPGARIQVVLTMRSEFLGACAMLPELAEKVSAGLFLVPQMKREEYQEAIEGPARVMGFKVQRALVNRLLTDLARLSLKASFQRQEQFERLAQGGDELPLLQHALNQLWVKAQDRNDEAAVELTLDDYERIGELSGALEKHGDEVLASIGKDAADCVEKVFLKLIRGTSVATALRRPLRFDELVSETGCDAQEVSRVVEGFGAPDCGFLSVPKLPIKDDTVIDIYHESLIRQWPRLKRWLALAQWSLVNLEELKRDAETWSRRAKRSEYLKLRGERLAEIKKIYGNAHGEGFGIVKAYLDACHARDLRSRLIDAVKGGNVSSAVAAIDELEEKQQPLLELEDRGSESLQLKPAFWAAVTGNDHPNAANGSKPGRDTPSIFDGDAGRWEMERTGSRGLTPLCWAVICGQEELVHKLVKLGDRSAEPSRLFEDGMTLTGLAAYGGHDSILSFLVDELKMSPLTLNRFGSPPIIWAIQGRHKQIVTYLRGKEQSLNVTTNDGWNALTEAARADDVEMATHLIKNEFFDVNGGGRTALPPLHVACLSSRAETAEVASLLLNEYGANIDIRDGEGWTCLHCAAGKGGKTSALKVLIDYGRNHQCLAELLQAVGPGDVTPLHSAVVGCPGAAELLLEAGAQPNPIDSSGMTPLIWAIYEGKHDSVQALLKWSADPNLHGSAAWPPLSFAANAGDLDMVEMLLGERRIDVEASTAGYPDLTAVMLAARECHIEIVLRLLEAGAFPGRADGINVFKIARQHSQLELREALKAYAPKNPKVLELLQAETGNEYGSPGKQSTEGMMEESVSPGKATTARTVEELITVYGSEVEAAAALGQMDRVKELMAAGADEPPLWRMKRVSEEAWFLSFTELDSSAVARLTASLEELRPSLRGQPEDWKLRSAGLSFLPGHNILAIEHTDIPGQNEQFAIEDPEGRLVLLDWTNEPIYSLLDRHPPKFDDVNLLLYCRFFFHWVRGQLGRFLLTDRVERIRWTGDVTDEIQDEVARKLQPLRIVERHENHVRMNGTVIFKNALFTTDIILALVKTEISNPDEDQPEEFSLGQLKLLNEDALLEELPIVIDRPPGILG